MNHTICRAVFKNGRFEPIEPIVLPEGTEVTFELPADSKDVDRIEAAQKRVFESLGRSYDTGQTDLAARHNEHQP